MSTFNYKKWITDHKYGLLYEQTGGNVTSSMVCYGCMGSTAVQSTPGQFGGYNIMQGADPCNFDYGSAGFIYGSVTQSVGQSTCPGTGSIGSGPVTGSATGSSTTGSSTTGSATGSATGSTSICYTCDTTASAAGQNGQTQNPSIANGYQPGTCYDINYVPGTLDPNAPGASSPANAAYWGNIYQSCTGSVGSGNSGPQFPGNWDPQTWWNTFLSNAQAKPWYATKKCNFFQSRINGWNTKLQSGIGPKQQNMLSSKIGQTSGEAVGEGCTFPGL